MAAKNLLSALRVTLSGTLESDSWLAYTGPTNGLRLYAADGSYVTLLPEHFVDNYSATGGFAVTDGSVGGMFVTHGGELSTDSWDFPLTAAAVALLGDAQWVGVRWGADNESWQLSCGGGSATAYVYLLDAESNAVSLLPPLSAQYFGGELTDSGTWSSDLTPVDLQFVAGTYAVTLASGVSLTPTVLTGASGYADGNTGSSVVSSLTCNGVVSTSARDWYEWTAPATARVVFSTPGSALNTNIVVVCGTLADGSGLALVAGNEDVNVDAGDYTSLVAFDAAAGATYYLAVGGYDGAVGAYDLQWASDYAGVTTNAADLFSITSISGTASSAVHEAQSFTAVAALSCGNRPRDAHTFVGLGVFSDAVVCRLVDAPSFSARGAVCFKEPAFPLSGRLPEQGVALVANGTTYAASFYDMYDVNSFAELAGVTYAACDAGLFTVALGEPVTTRVALGDRTFGSPHAKLVSQVRYTGAGDATVSVTCDGGVKYTYTAVSQAGRNHRALTGRGLRGARVSVQVDGAQQLDDVDVVVAVSSRR